MIEFIMRIIFGHNHKWVEVGKYDAVKSRGEIPEGCIRLLQCEVCGKMRNHKVKW